MSFWRQLTRGVRALVNRRSADDDIADEVANYLDESTAAFLAQGLAPEEAGRRARAEMGSTSAVREQVRTSGWENHIDSFFADLRYTTRRLKARPGFTAISILTLALGMGASTAIFSVTEGVLIKPLPYPHSERLVALMHSAPGINIPSMGLAVSFYFTYSEESHVFQEVGMWAPDSWTVTGLGTPEEVPGLSVSHRFLPALGIAPAFGRNFTTGDEDRSGERTVMLSDGYWRRHFAGERSVLGRRIRLDGDAVTVIAVLPPSFDFMGRKVELIAPFQLHRADTNLISFCCQGIARLKPGVTLEQANADVARMLPLAPLKFRMNPGWSRTSFVDARFAPRLQPLKDYVVGDIGKTLWLLVSTVGIVLLIACANVANLLLVRADGRRQELAVRAALGAGWERLAQELLLESVLLSLAGGALGLLLAWGGLRVLVASELPNLPRIHEIGIDPTVVAVAFGIALGTGLMFGLIPVFRYARPQASGLRGETRSTTGSRERHRARGVLVAVQVALALVLLAGSGLMIRTFLALRHVDPGFSGAAQMETVRIGIPDTEVKEPERITRMQQEILEKLRALPGVSAVGLISDLPMNGGGNDPIFVEGRRYREGTLPAVRRFKFISPGYLAAAGSRLIAGRDVTWAETYSRTPVALVSENMARELWGDARAAIGKRIRTTSKDDWREVIGVVADVRDDGLYRPAPSIVFWPMLLKNFQSQPGMAIHNMVYVMRTPRAGTTAFRAEVARAVAAVNPTLALSEVFTLESIYDRSLARTSFTLVLLAIAGFVALVLGVVGIYGVVSYSVSQRRREVGIRLALGAPVKGITGLFVRDGLAMSGAGAVCGLAAALALTRLMKSLLFEVSPADPLTYVAAVGALVLAAALGSWLPARRAARVDPAETLRAE